MKPGLGTESLLGAALAGRAPRAEPSPRREADAGFAGLLDGARQKQGGGTYDGSAFDVPEPKSSQPPSRTGTQADIERRQLERRQQQTGSEAQREASSAERRRDAAPRAAEAKPLSDSNKPRAAEPPREAGAAARGSESEAAAQTEDTEGAQDVAADAPCEARGRSIADEPTPASSPTTQEWMARWATLSGSAASATREAALPTSPLPRVGAAGGATSAGDAAAAQAAAPSSGAPGEPASAASAASAGASDLRAETRAEAAAPALAAARIDAPAAMPPGHAATPASTPTASTAAPAATANVPVPLNSPDFSQALGWQLATLARDGVHEAQLQLNPVEMGPVQVQIVLDGGQAQIDFTAAQSRTREVLEAGWPALAAAMNSAGFTLGGGGVFEQRSQGGDAQDNGAGPRSRRGHDDGDALATPGVTRLAGAGPRGLLDLYA